jgi:hypothetical protein
MSVPRGPAIVPSVLSALVLLVIAPAGVRAAEVPEEIRLWPDGVPGDRVPAEPAETVERGKDDIQRRSHVSDPRLVVHALPEIPGKLRPAVIILPGGGYNILADDLEGTEIGRFLNGHGIVAFTLLYRVPTGNLAESDAGPVMDAQKAVSVVRGRAAEFGVDPARIGLMGFSAGGIRRSSRRPRSRVFQPLPPTPRSAPTARSSFIPGVSSTPRGRGCGRASSSMPRPRRHSSPRRQTIRLRRPRAQSPSSQRCSTRRSRPNSMSTSGAGTATACADGRIPQALPTGRRGWSIGSRGVASDGRGT